MKADAKALNFITNESIIRIPFFQRPYVWTKDNWEELFDDLNSDKYHFLGSIMFKQQHAQTGQPKEVFIDRWAAKIDYHFHIVEVHLR